MLQLVSFSCKAPGRLFSMVSTKHEVPSLATLLAILHVSFCFSGTFLESFLLSSSLSGPDFLKRLDMGFYKSAVVAVSDQFDLQTFASLLIIIIISHVFVNVKLTCKYYSFIPASLVSRYNCITSTVFRISIDCIQFTPAIFETTFPFSSLVIFCSGHAAYGSAVKLNPSTSTDIVKCK